MVTKKSTKKSAAKKSTAKKASSKVSLISLQREQQDFMSFNITIQTVYWLILGAIVILFTMWILQVQADIEEIYNQIDANLAD